MANRIKHFFYNLYYKALIIKRYAWAIMFTNLILNQRKVLLEALEKSRLKAAKKFDKQKPVEFEKRDLPLVGETLERYRERIDKDFRDSDNALVRKIYRDSEGK